MFERSFVSVDLLRDRYSLPNPMDTTVSAAHSTATTTTTPLNTLELVANSGKRAAQKPVIIPMTITGAGSTEATGSVGLIGVASSTAAATSASASASAAVPTTGTPKRGQSVSTAGEGAGVKMSISDQVTRYQEEQAAEEQEQNALTDAARSFHQISSGATVVSAAAASASSSSSSAALASGPLQPYQPAPMAKQTIIPLPKKGLKCVFRREHDTLMGVDTSGKSYQGDGYLLEELRELFRVTLRRGDDWKALVFTAVKFMTSGYTEYFMEYLLPTMLNEEKGFTCSWAIDEWRELWLTQYPQALKDAKHSASAAGRKTAWKVRPAMDLIIHFLLKLLLQSTSRSLVYLSQIAGENVRREDLHRNLSKLEKSVSNDVKPTGVNAMIEELKELSDPKVNRGLPAEVLDSWKDKVELERPIMLAMWAYRAHAVLGHVADGNYAEVEGKLWAGLEVQIKRKFADDPVAQEAFQGLRVMYSRAAEHSKDPAKDSGLRCIWMHAVMLLEYAENALWTGSDLSEALIQECSALVTELTDPEKKPFSHRLFDLPVTGCLDYAVTERGCSVTDTKSDWNQLLNKHYLHSAAEKVKVSESHGKHHYKTDVKYWEMPEDVFYLDDILKFKAEKAISLAKDELLEMRVKEGLLPIEYVDALFERQWEEKLYPLFQHRWNFRLGLLLTKPVTVQRKFVKRTLKSMKEEEKKKAEDAELAESVADLKESTAAAAAAAPASSSSSAAAAAAATESTPMEDEEELPVVKKRRRAITIPEDEEAADEEKSAAATTATEEIDTKKAKSKVKPASAPSVTAAPTAQAPEPAAAVAKPKQGWKTAAEAASVPMTANGSAIKIVDLENDDTVAASAAAAASVAANNVKKSKKKDDKSQTADSAASEVKKEEKEKPKRKPRASAAAAKSKKETSSEAGPASSSSSAAASTDAAPNAAAATATAAPKRAAATTGKRKLEAFDETAQAAIEEYLKAAIPLPPIDAANIYEMPILTEIKEPNQKMMFVGGDGVIKGPYITLKPSDVRRIQLLMQRQAYLKQFGQLVAQPPDIMLMREIEQPHRVWVLFQNISTVDVKSWLTHDLPPTEVDPFKRKKVSQLSMKLSPARQIDWSTVACKSVWQVVCCMLVGLAADPPFGDNSLDSFIFHTVETRETRLRVASCGVPAIRVQLEKERDLSSSSTDHKSLDDLTAMVSPPPPKKPKTEDKTKKNGEQPKSNGDKKEGGTDETTATEEEKYKPWVRHLFTTKNPGKSIIAAMEKELGRDTGGLQQLEFIRHSFIVDTIKRLNEVNPAAMKKPQLQEAFCSLASLCNLNIQRAVKELLQTIYKSTAAPITTAAVSAAADTAVTKK